MQRKLVKMGAHSLMTVLPKKWIDKHELGKGDIVEFNEVNNKLVISSTKEIFERKTEINIDVPTKHIIWRLIQPVYTSGYDEVKINFSDKKSLEYIEWSMSLLIGFEIVDIQENHIIVKSVSKKLDEDIKPIMKRIWQILIQISKITIEAFENENKEDLQKIFPLEMTINKYAMLVKRIINRTSYKHHHYKYSIINFLELVPNHFEYIRRAYLEHKTISEMTKEYLKYSKKMNKLIEQVYDLQYKYSEEKFKEIEKRLPHFFLFETMSEGEIKKDFIIMAEYLMQIARLVHSINFSK